MDAIPRILQALQWKIDNSFLKSISLWLGNLSLDSQSLPVSRRGFRVSGLSEIGRLRCESWGFRKCTADWMKWNLWPESQKQTNGDKILGIWRYVWRIRIQASKYSGDLDRHSGTPAPKMRSWSKMHAKIAVFSLFSSVFHSQNLKIFACGAQIPRNP